MFHGYILGYLLQRERWIKMFCSLLAHMTESDVDEMINRLVCFLTFPDVYLIVFLAFAKYMYRQVMHLICCVAFVDARFISERMFKVFFLAFITPFFSYYVCQETYRSCPFSLL